MKPPLLLIDIDGVISLFGFDHAQPPHGNYVAVDGIAHFLSTEAGEQLIALSDDFELVWCSGWEEKADEHLPFALGLPAGLAHLTFEHRGQRRRTPLEARHRSNATPAPTAHWPGSTTTTTPAATRGRRRAPAPTLLVTTRPAVRA